MKLIILIIVVLIGMTITGIQLYTNTVSGDLVIRLKDPPLEWGQAEEVYISFNNVLIHKADAGNESGWLNTHIVAVNMSLSKFVFLSGTIGIVSLPTGFYNLIRFEVTQAIVTVNARNYTCTIESGKLNVHIVGGGISIKGGQTSYLELDIIPKITGKSDKFKLIPATSARVV